MPPAGLFYCQPKIRNAITIEPATAGSHSQLPDQAHSAIVAAVG
jgi:hypothetical protein